MDNIAKCPAHHPRPRFGKTAKKNELFNDAPNRRYLCKAHGERAARRFAEATYQYKKLRHYEYMQQECDLRITQRIAALAYSWRRYLDMTSAERTIAIRRDLRRSRIKAAEDFRKND